MVSPRKSKQQSVNLKTKAQRFTSLAAAAIGVGWLAMSPMEMASLRSF